MYRQLKQQLLITLIDRLEQMSQQAQASAEDAQAEANYHVGAMESRYDTFKEEAQYLTEAQKLRLQQLQLQVSNCHWLLRQLHHQPATDTMVQGALAQVGEPGCTPTWVFIAPAGLHLQLETTLGIITCVTEHAPLVCHGIGLTQGEEYEVQRADEHHWYTIMALY